RATQQHIPGPSRASSASTELTTIRSMWELYRGIPARSTRAVARQLGEKTLAMPRPGCRISHDDTRCGGCQPPYQHCHLRPTCLHFILARPASNRDDRAGFFCCPSETPPVVHAQAMWPDFHVVRRVFAVLRTH